MGTQKVKMDEGATPKYWVMLVIKKGPKILKKQLVNIDNTIGDTVAKFMTEEESAIVGIKGYSIDPESSSSSCPRHDAAAVDLNYETPANILKDFKLKYIGGGVVSATDSL